MLYRLFQIHFHRLDLYFGKDHDVLVQVHPQRLLQLVFRVFERHLLFFQGRACGGEIHFRLEQLIAGSQVGFHLILDNLVALLCIGQFLPGNGQLALCHIDGIELLGNILFRTQPLQGVADVGILIIIFDLLQFHLTLVISKDGLRELQVEVVAECLVTGLRTVDIGVVILPAETVDQREDTIRPQDRLVHLERSGRTEPLVRVPLRQAVVETAALAVIHRIEVQRELRLQGSPLRNQVLLITFQVHVGTAQGRAMLFRYIHRLLDRQRDLSLRRGRQPQADGSRQHYLFHG